MNKYDYLIVGSGLFGATFAYRAKQMGKKCLVIDKRPNLGGNLYCERIEGINIHKYGAHIFHTSNKNIWNFVNSITEFNRYTNSPIANYKGELYNLPFNMNTFNKMWPEVHTPAQAQMKLNEQRQEAFVAINIRHEELGLPLLKATSNGVEGTLNLEEQALCLVGKDIFNKLIKEYTEKQWGRKCCDLPAFIIRRLPMRLIFDNNYFNDKYQGIPIGGYNKLIDGLLEGVETKVNFDFFKDSLDLADSCSLKENWQKYACHLVYTGPIDEYFDYILGKLDWRTVSFKTRIENTPNYQGNAVVNYTSNDKPYTRVIEHKHFEMFGQEVYDCPKTVVSEEYSEEYREGMEPYYPINDEHNNALARKYRDLAHRGGVIFPDDDEAFLTKKMREENTILFGGRLGQYKYFDMAPIIEQIFKINIK